MEDRPAPLFSHPPPRLKRTAKHEALRSQDDDEQAATDFGGVLSPTIRPVTDASLKVYSTSPFPTTASQRFEPPSGQLLGHHAPNPEAPVSATNATDATRPRLLGPREPVPPSPIKYPEAHSWGARPSAQHGPGPAPARPPQSAAAPTPQDGPPREAAADADDDDDGRAGTARHLLPASIIDVDRLVMDEGPSNLNIAPRSAADDAAAAALPIPPRSPARRILPPGFGSSPPPLPQTPRGGLVGGSGNGHTPTTGGSGALAPPRATPGTVSSIGSSGTVVRQRDFEGPVASGHFSHFPPDERSPPSSSGAAGDHFRPRSSSLPDSPTRVRLSGVEASYVGSGSPVSPISPTSDTFEPGDRSPEWPRSSDPRLDAAAVTSSPCSPNLQVLADSSSPAAADAASPAPGAAPSARAFTIPRRPIGRPNTVRWHTTMSTIMSDSGSERAAGGSSPRKSPTPARFSRASLTSRASPATGTTRSSSATPDFSRLSSPFPLPQPLFSNRNSRTVSQAATPLSGTFPAAPNAATAATTATSAPPSAAIPPAIPPTIRPVLNRDRLEQDLPPIPLHPTPSNTSGGSGSPTRKSSSVYSKPEYRDSGVQTSRAGSLFRDSLPAWARYFLSHPLSRSPSLRWPSSSSPHVSDFSEKYFSLLEAESAAATRMGSAARTTGSSAPRTTSADWRASLLAPSVSGRRQPGAVAGPQRGSAVDPADLPSYFSPTDEWHIPTTRRSDRHGRAYYAQAAAGHGSPRSPPGGGGLPYAAAPAPTIRRRPSSRASRHSGPRRHTVSGGTATPPHDPYPPRDSLRPPPHPRPRTQRPMPRGARAPPIAASTSPRATGHSPSAAFQPPRARRPSGPGGYYGSDAEKAARHSGRTSRYMPPGVLASTDGGAAVSEHSPHLHHARHSAARRRSAFRAPSLDERAEGARLSRRNAQVLAFALGFICPLAWIVAACLPLPARPASQPPSPQFERDLEETLGPQDLARYENARWWRVVNRVMSVAGCGIIIAIVGAPPLSLRLFSCESGSTLTESKIVLAVVASRAQ